MNTRPRHPYPRGGDHERMAQVRREAEALFAPKGPIGEPSVPGPPALADSSSRKPRILRALSTAPVHHEESEAPVRSGPPPPRNPRAHFARIRTLAKYGMTIPQIAQIYGVTVSEIERILRKT